MRLERMFQQAPGFMCLLEGPDHIFRFINNAHRILFNSDDWLGKPVRDAFPAAADQGYVDLLNRVYSSGEGYVARASPIHYRRAPDEPDQERLLDFIYEPIVDEFGRVTGVFCEGFDVTESSKAERHRTLLLDELNHRVKNTLAVVQAIARQTLKRDGDIIAMRNAFEGRLGALAAAHHALTRTSWVATPLREIAEGALGAAGAASGRINMSGEPIALEPKAAITMSLVLHELCTNAMKYGALSNNTGVVNVAWCIDADGSLDLEWKESGGPVVSPPTHRGFGGSMIERAVVHDIHGCVSMDYRPEGLTCAINAPIQFGEACNAAH